MVGQNGRDVAEPSAVAHDGQAAPELGGYRWPWSRPPPICLAVGVPWPDTLAVFGGRQGEPVGRDQAARHPADVAAILGLAMSRLGNEAPAASRLLRLLAFLCPRAVQFALLLSNPRVAAQPAPEVAAVMGPLWVIRSQSGDAVAVLRRCSLVTSP